MLSIHSMLWAVLWETTPSRMATSQFKYIILQLRWGEFSLAQWLWYWLFIQASPGSNPVQILFFCHAFIHLFLSYGLCS